MNNTRQRILLIEGNPDTQTLISEALQLAHYKVICANSAEEGLSLAFRVYPDAIISAEWLLGMTGSEMILQLRTDPLMAETPIILLTDFNNRSTIDVSLGRADEYLGEPFAVSDLLKRLDYLITRKSFKATGSWLKGDLRGFGLPDVLMMTQQNRLTGLLKVTSDSTDLKFQFFFDQGELIGVRGDNVKGRKALNRAIRIEGGRFLFFPWRQIKRKSWHETLQINNLILLAVQEQDELPILLEKLPDSTLQLQDDHDIDALRDHSSAEVLAPLLDQQLTQADLKTLIDLSTQSDLDAATDIQTLIKAGVLRATS